MENALLLLEFLFLESESDVAQFLMHLVSRVCQGQAGAWGGVDGGVYLSVLRSEVLEQTFGGLLTPWIEAKVIDLVTLLLQQLGHLKVSDGLAIISHFSVSLNQRVSLLDVAFDKPNVVFHPEVPLEAFDPSPSGVVSPILDTL